MPNFTAFDCEGEAHEFAELLSIRPDTGGLNRGVVHYERGDYAQAQRDLEHGLSLDPAHPMAEACRSRLEVCRKRLGR